MFGVPPLGGSAVRTSFFVSCLQDVEPAAPEGSQTRLKAVLQTGNNGGAATVLVALGDAGRSTSGDVLATVVRARKKTLRELKVCGTKGMKIRRIGPP